MAQVNGFLVLPGKHESWAASNMIRGWKKNARPAAEKHPPAALVRVCSSWSCNHQHTPAVEVHAPRSLMSLPRSKMSMYGFAGKISGTTRKNKFQWRRLVIDHGILELELLRQPMTAPYLVSKMHLKHTVKSRSALKSQSFGSPNISGKSPN